MSVVTKCSVLTAGMALVLCFTFSAWAEMGKGTVEDPRTRQYTDGIYQEWVEGVLLHSETGNYLVVYKDSYGFFNQVVFEPATKVDPVVKSRFVTEKKNGLIVYEYKLKNGKESTQSIRAIRTTISGAKPGYPAGPESWRSAVQPNDKGGFNLSWSTVKPGVSSSGLPPGKSAHGFRLESNDLPGVVVMRIEGAASRTAWLGHIPEIDTPVGAQVNKLLLNNFVPRLAAVPRLPVGNPYDGAAVLDVLRGHITKDIVDLELIEPTLASELDRVLQAAADAIRRNSVKAARDHLHDAFKLVHKAHPDLDKDDWDEKDVDTKDKGKAGNVHPIDRLAARVIAFDIKYVEKRLKN